MTATMASVTLVAPLTLLSYFLFALFRKLGRRRVPLPPGPRPWPLLGNIADLRPHQLWLLASDWAKRYGRSPRLFLLLQPLQFTPGDVVYLHIFGQGLVFLNSPAAVFELMERRSAIYSDRAPLVMATELFVPYTDTTFTHRLTMSVFPCFQLWCWTHGTHPDVTVALRASHSIIAPGCLYALRRRIPS
jgi:hypothetical protein